MWALLLLIQLIQFLGRGYRRIETYVRVLEKWKRVCYSFEITQSCAKAGIAKLPLEICG